MRGFRFLVTYGDPLLPSVSDANGLGVWLRHVANGREDKDLTPSDDWRAWLWARPGELVELTAHLADDTLTEDGSGWVMSWVACDPDGTVYASVVVRMETSIRRKSQL